MIQCFPDAIPYGIILPLANDLSAQACPDIDDNRALQIGCRKAGQTDAPTRGSLVPRQSKAPPIAVFRRRTSWKLPSSLTQVVIRSPVAALMNLSGKRGWSWSPLRRPKHGLRARLTGILAKGAAILRSLILAIASLMRSQKRQGNHCCSRGMTLDTRTSRPFFDNSVI